MMFSKTVSVLEWRLGQKIFLTDLKDVEKFAASINKTYQLGKLKDISEDEMKAKVFMSGLDTPETELYLESRILL